MIKKQVLEWEPSNKLFEDLKKEIEEHVRKGGAVPDTVLVPGWVFYAFVGQGLRGHSVSYRIVSPDGWKDVKVEIKPDPEVTHR